MLKISQTTQNTVTTRPIFNAVLNIILFILKVGLPCESQMDFFFKDEKKKRETIDECVGEINTNVFGNFTSFQAITFLRVQSFWSFVTFKNQWRIKSEWNLNNNFNQKRPLQLNHPAHTFRHTNASNLSLTSKCVSITVTHFASTNHPSSVKFSTNFVSSHSFSS